MGAIYIHLDWHVGHYAKAMLDEVFGDENFRMKLSGNDTHSTSVQGGHHIGRESTTYILFYCKDRASINVNFAAIRRSRWTEYIEPLSDTKTQGVATASADITRPGSAARVSTYSMERSHSGNWRSAKKRWNG